MSEKLQRFYKSEAWENFRKIVIANRMNDGVGLICEHCGKPILKKYDCILHHIEELTDDNVDDVSISLNEDNIRLVHFGCHNQLHKRNVGSAGVSVPKKVYFVWGSPCAGKNTFVDSVADENDIIIDIDRLWAAVRWSGCGEYDKPWVLKDVVFGLRDSLLDMIKVRRGNWHNAYIITAKCIPSEISHMCETLGVDRCIHIDTDKTTCLERLRNANDRDIENWTEYIERYFELYELYCV